jgi:phage baseplate assembly protein gpV
MSQQSKASLQFAINTQIADNTSGDISAADIRDNLISLTDSLLFNSGSQTFTGSLTVDNGITGSLLGTSATASYVTGSVYTSANPALSASYALSSSRTVASNRVLVMGAGGSGTLYPLLGSTSTGDANVNIINSLDYKYNLSTNQLIISSISASSFTGSLSGSSTSASYATQALSASWAPAVASNPFPFTGSAVISGSLTITGSINSTGSVILGRPDYLGNRNLNISFNNEFESVSLGAGLGINSKTNRISFDSVTGASNIAATSSIGLFAPTTNIVSPITNITGSAIISGSLGVTGSLTLSTIPDINTGYINMLSYGGIRIADNDFYEMKLTVDNPSGDSSAVSPGFMIINGVGGYGMNIMVASSTSGETESTINFYGPANSRIQSSQQLILSGSSVNIGRLMTLQPLNPLPSVTNGSIAYSSSGDFYFGSGSAWRKLTL